jgi:hypothetical protein
LDDARFIDCAPVQHAGPVRRGAARQGSRAPGPRPRGVAGACQNLHSACVRKPFLVSGVVLFLDPIRVITLLVLVEIRQNFKVVYEKLELLSF